MNAEQELAELREKLISCRGLSETRRQQIEALETLVRGHVHMSCAVPAAFIKDRVAQYNLDSGSRAMLEEIASSIDRGEHLDAFTHDELDDLLRSARERKS